MKRENLSLVRSREMRHIKYIYYQIHKNSAQPWFKQINWFFKEVLFFFFSRLNHTGLLSTIMRTEQNR